MKKEYKVSLLIVGIFLLLSLLVSFSYAYYMFGVSQSGYNAIVGDCFRITFADEEALNINNATPMYDSVVDSLTPYTFYITNVCNYEMNYSVSLETLNSTTMSLDAIKVKIDDKNPKLLGNIADNDSNSIINDNAISSKTIDHGHLEGNSTKTLNLRVWIDVNSTVEQSANKEFNSKVVVNATIGGDAYLASGAKFNAAMKKLSGVEVSDSVLDNLEYFRQIYPTECDPSSENYESNKSMCILLTKTNILTEDTFAYFNNVDELIKQFKIVDEMPSNVENYEIVSNDDSNCDIYLWFDNGIIYLYTEANKIYATDMSYMFYNLKNIASIDLSIFDTSKTTDMSYMFAYYNALVDTLYRGVITNIDISHFDTSKVTDMSFMFAGLTELNHLDVSNFDTSNVEDMSGMFAALHSVDELDLSNFNTSKVTNMNALFHFVTGLKRLDLSNFDTSNVTNMSQMFNLMSSLTSLDLSNFDTSNVTDMGQMFSGVENVTELNLENFDTSKVTKMSSMFQNMFNLTNLNISNFDTSNVIYMDDMFYGVHSLISLDVSSFDTSKVSNMSYMFSNMNSLTSLDVSNFDTSSVTTFDNMFNSCSNIETLDVSSFNTSAATSFGHMFHKMNSLKTIYASSLFDTSNVSRLNIYRYGYLFDQDTLLVGGAGTVYNSDHVDVEYARIDDPANGKPGYFTLKTS